MIKSMLRNGNRRIARLAVSKVMWGTVVMVLSQIQGFLPSLDFLDAKHLKLLAFGLAVFLTASKGVEMFFDQTMQLFKEHPELPAGDTEFFTQPTETKE